MEVIGWIIIILAVIVFSAMAIIPYLKKMLPKGDEDKWGYS